MQRLFIEKINRTYISFSEYCFSILRIESNRSDPFKRIEIVKLTLL